MIVQPSLPRQADGLQDPARAVVQSQRQARGADEQFAERLEIPSLGAQDEQGLGPIDHAHTL